VFAGHVDTRRGPAVFAQLDRLRPGDLVEVPRSDGGTARYSVDSVEYFPKDTMPSDRIYGPATTPQLRLLTCGGPFDEGTLSYRDNVVVFASAR
jgi:sortase (surface protein transpeptidase)